MSGALIDRLYRGLFVYSVGVHSLIADAVRHCPQGGRLIHRLWPAYLRLLETADPQVYEVCDIESSC
jgi:hypothetical protein